MSEPAVKSQWLYVVWLMYSLDRFFFLQCSVPSTSLLFRKMFNQNYFFYADLNVVNETVWVPWVLKPRHAVLHSYYGDRIPGLHILNAEEFIWDNGFQEYNSPCQMYSFPVELASPPPTHTHTHCSRSWWDRKQEWTLKENSWWSQNPTQPSKIAPKDPEFKLMSLWETLACTGPTGSIWQTWNH